MSIFKETIAESIQTQLQARTKVIAGNSSSTINNSDRNNLLPFYLSKNSWVRMTSFVNFNEGPIVFDGKGDIKTDTTKGHYKGDQLSKKYILEGGTLYTKSNGTDIIEASQRYGVTQQNSVYGGNIDVRADNTVDPKYFRTYGIRPMPGIIDVNMHTKSAYGSLFETTIKFYAWDINQLNELELLFMRPGYSVLLEWGWSQYLDYENDKLKSDLTSDKIKPQVFNGVTINPFENLSQQEIYNKLETLRVKYRHNYDGMLGYIKNFSWKMMKNGGYECQTTLISMGEVINSLKISTNSNFTKNTTELNINDLDTKAYSFDEYENILLSLKFLVESKNFPYLKKIYSTDEEVYAINEDEYRGTWKASENSIPISDIKTKLEEAGFKKYANYLDKQPVLQKIVNNASKDNLSDNGLYYEYISLDVWFAIMASYFNLKTSNNSSNNQLKPDYFTKIIPPQDNSSNDPDLCLAGSDTLSTDPSICIVKNSKAFANELGFLDLGDYNQYTGIQPQVTISDESSVSLAEFYSDDLKAGYIGNIYVNLSLLLGEYKSLKNNASDDGVGFMTYVNNILKKISNAMGGLNNFGLSTIGRDQNQVKLVDLYYLETKAKPKYKFDLMGLGSICRNVEIESQIFPEQSTIIAIAAQSRANLGDVYNSTQVYLNAGLEDRIAVAKWQGEEDQPPNGDVTDPIYQKTFDFLLYLKDYIIGNPNENYEIQTETNGSIPYTFLKQFLLRFDGELNFKALIPFKLKITLDGIGGIIVGQIFQVNPNVLPKNYIDKNLGFIVTGISHTLNKNDWETQLETQICILDQAKFYDINGKHVLSNNIQREKFANFLGAGIIKALLYPVIVDFCEYQALKSLLLGTSENNRWFYDLDLLVKEPISEKTIQRWERQWKPRLTKRHFEFNTKGDTAVGFEQDNDVSLVRNYGIDSFFGFFRKWVELELNFNATAAKKATLVTPNLTYEKALRDLADFSSNNKNYNTIIEIQQKIAQNIDMFYYPLFTKTFDYIAVPGRPSIQDTTSPTWYVANNDVLSFNSLRSNIERELLNRNIVSRTIVNSYYHLKLPNKTTLSVWTPIKNNSAWDNGNKSMNEHYNVAQRNLRNGKQGIETSRFTGYKDETNIMQAWMNSLTLFPDNYNDDKRFKDHFINSFYLTN